VSDWAADVSDGAADVSMRPLCYCGAMSAVNDSRVYGRVLLSVAYECGQRQ
jgi:hypothetical protein